MNSFPSSDSNGSLWVGPHFGGTTCQQLEAASSAPWEKNIAFSSFDRIRMLWPDEIHGHLWQAREICDYEGIDIELDSFLLSAVASSHPFTKDTG